MGQVAAAERATRETDDAGKLCASGVAEDLRRGLQAYESARALWQQAGDKRRVAMTSLRIGEVLTALHDDSRAEKILTEARALAREVGDGDVEAASLVASGRLLLRRADLQGSLAQVEAAYDISVRRKNGAAQAAASAVLAEIYYNTGDIKKAYAAALTSLEAAHKTNSPRGVAFALFTLGYISMAKQVNDKALEFLNKSLKASRDIDDLPGIVDAQTQIGHLYSMRGEKQKALDIYLSTEPIAERLQDPERQGRLYNGLDFVNQELGNAELSIQYCRKTLEMYHAANYSLGEAQIYRRLGGHQARVGQFVEALRNYQQALSFFQKNGMNRNLYSVLSDIGELYAAQGNDATASDYYRQARQLISVEDDPREYSYLLNRIGRVTERMKGAEAALAFYLESLRLNRNVSDLFGEAQTLLLLAGAEKKSGNLPAARAYIEAAIEIDERLRDEVAVKDLRTSFFAEANQHFNFYIDLLMRPADGDPAAGSLKALEISERKRARSLLDEIARARMTYGAGGETAALGERARRLKAQIAERRDEYAKSKQAGGGASQTAAVASELSRLQQEYDQLQSVINSGGDSHGARPVPLTAREIQNTFNEPGTLLLEYSLGEERSFLWAVAHDGVTSYELPGRPEVESEVLALNRVIKLMTPRRAGGAQSATQSAAADVERQFDAQAQRLTALLLAPAAARIAAARRLVIVADGPLHYVPFAALPEPASESGPTPANSHATDEASARSLLAEREITLLPSVSVLAKSRQRSANAAAPRKAVAIIANPVFERDDGRLQTDDGSARKATADRLRQTATRTRGATDDAEAVPLSNNEPTASPTLSQLLRDLDPDAQTGTALPRLFSTQREADDIRALAGEGQSFAALGFNAKRSALTDDRLKDYRFIHIATHGFYDSEHPELSGIVLSLYDERGRPQDGFVQIRDIYNLELNADMVVLSACQTGLGKELKGEGINGLARAFMSAGARRVVASLWRVDDDATAELMTAFYRHMLKEGMSPSAALRSAQLEISAVPRWRRPFYWAGFFISGDFR